MKKLSLFRSSSVLGKLAVIFVIAVLVVACSRPVTGPGGHPRGLSSRQIRSQAHHAVVDFIIDRHGLDARPRTSHIVIRGYDFDEARVTGRASYYRRSYYKRRVEVDFRCWVHRGSGRVRGIDLH